MATAPILITGGAQRLGLATALALAEDGHQVWISYRRERPGLTKLRDAGVRCIKADFADDAGIRDFIGQVKQDASQLRAVIHNASEWLPESSGESPSVVMQRMMQIHVSTPYQINLALADLLTRSPGTADIIHITDYVAETGSQKHIGYAASKAALENLTLSFAALLAPSIKVNTIAPSLMLFNEHDDDEYREKTLRKSLMGIEPGAEEMVETVRFLLQSRYVTGRKITLDGGRHLAMRR